MMILPGRPTGAERAEQLFVLSTMTADILLSEGVMQCGHTVSAIIVPILIGELGAYFLVSLPVITLAFTTAIYSHEASATLLVSVLLAAFCARHDL